MEMEEAPATRVDAVSAVSLMKTGVEPPQVEMSAEALQNALDIGEEFCARKHAAVARGAHAAAHRENVAAQKKPSKLKGGGKKAKADASNVLAAAEKARDEAEKKLREVEEIINGGQFSGASAASGPTAAIDPSSAAPSIPTASKVPVIPDPPVSSTSTVASTAAAPAPSSASSNGSTIGETPGIPNPSATATDTTSVQDSKTVIDVGKGVVPGDYTEIDEEASKGCLESVKTELKNTAVVTGGEKRKSDAIDGDNRPEGKTAAAKRKRQKKKKARGSDGEEDANRSSLDDNNDGGEGEAKVEGFDKLSAQKREELLRKGNAALDDYLANPSYGIPSETRKMIRANQSYLPRAAYTSREMALECLRTNRDNTFCLYHHRTDKQGRARDGQGKYKLNGVPMQRAASYKKSDGVPSAKGHLHCGCDIDIALADFIHWKTWTVTGVVDGEEVTESLQDQLLQPRERLFVVKNFEKATKLKLGDLYRGNRNEREFEKRKREKQMFRCLEILNKMREEENQGKLEITVCDDSAE
ncbi:hypothetical protein BD779DRAFT_1477256 [Infundibulicybe gibba]|nr:hypothetical protein BD779DRAFT_1477256 [Infundibulicybe gibba]